MLKSWLMKFLWKIWKEESWTFSEIFFRSVDELEGLEWDNAWYVSKWYNV